MEVSRKQLDDPASVDHAEPGDEGVTQAASRAEDGKEAVARDAQSARGERKRQKRNGRRKQGGKKNREDSVTLYPSDDSPEQTRRHIAP